jgi:hypothetical protein
MVSLPGHGPNYFVHLFGVLVVFIRLKVADVAGKFGLDNSYCYLPPVCDM